MEAFKSLNNLIRARKYYIDESIFRLHCLYTSTLLFFFFVIISSKQIAGEPIDCFTIGDSVKASVLNAFCLIHYTYTINDGADTKIGDTAAAPGVRTAYYGENERHHNYYQWIWCIFFVQAICFYSPRWIWKSLESGTIGHLVSGVNGFLKEGDKDQKKTLIVNYMLKNRDNSESYARNYLFCLLLAVSNVFSQMVSLDYLFDGEFFAYGFTIFEFLSTDPDYRKDTLIRVFPRVTKCRFNNYGPSGSVQELDALCVLPLNMYNEKIFVFIWFWFSLLAILLSASILMKLILIISPFMRFYYVRREFRLKKWWPGRDAKRFDAENLKFGEIFVLLLVKQNTGLMFSKEVLQELLLKYEQKKTMKEENIQLIDTKDQTKIEINDKMVNMNQSEFK